MNGVAPDVAVVDDAEADIGGDLLHQKRMEVTMSDDDDFGFVKGDESWHGNENENVSETGNANGNENGNENGRWVRMARERKSWGNQVECSTITK